MPESFAYNDNVVRTGLIFLRKEKAAAHRLNAESSEETRSDSRVGNPLRFTVAGEIDSIVGEGRDVLKVRALLFPGEILVGGDARQITGRRSFVNGDELLRIAKRQRLQQHRIHDTEDRGVHTDR